VPAENNKKLWKLKMSLKIKLFGWYIWKGVILTKDNLAKSNWHGSKKCVFIIKIKQSHIYSSNIVLLVLYGQSFNYLQPCIHHAMPSILEIGFTVLITGLECLLGWERLP
jgi:hypothetical protein